MASTAAHPMRTDAVLRIILLLAAIHSFATGVGLILQPASLLYWGGWGSIDQHFFPAQGGVFHILMAGLYVLAFRSADARAMLLPFIVFVKTTAAVFLLFYYAFFEPIWMVLASAVVDGVFAAVLLYYFRRIRLTDHRA